MIGVLGNFGNPTTGTYAGKPCGWAVWKGNGRNWEWEAFTSDKCRGGTAWSSQAASERACRALDLLKQVKA